MSNWTLLNECRVSPKQDRVFGTWPAAGFNGFFCLVLNGLRVKCIASDGDGWKHVSVSIEGQTISAPSWNMMCQVKDLFWESNDWVVQFHPAKGEYVNTHPGCLHLWQSTAAPQPIPVAAMVGIKNDEHLAEVMADESIPASQREMVKSVYQARKAFK